MCCSPKVGISSRRASPIWKWITPPGAPSLRHRRMHATSQRPEAGCKLPTSFPIEGPRVLLVLISLLQLLLRFLTIGQISKLSLQGQAPSANAGRDAWRECDGGVAQRLRVLSLHKLRQFRRKGRRAVLPCGSLAAPFTQNRLGRITVGVGDRHAPPSEIG